MATRHRHTESEIAEKLHIASEMAAQGKLHSAIAKSLGISVMTYHRWRKARGTSIRPTVQLAEDGERTIERQQMSQIRELQVLYSIAPEDTFGAMEIGAAHAAVARAAIANCASWGRK